MDNITTKQFLQAVFPPDLMLENERPVVGYPDSFISRDTGKQVDYYRQFHPGRRTAFSENSWYFCLSTIEHQRKRQVKKRLEDVRTAMVLVVDDVCTKSIPPIVTPSYMLETSEGNWQWGYLIEPFDVSTPAGQAYFDACLWSLAEAGHNDPGFRSASRFARLPGSLHRTGFKARITSWEPDRVWDLEYLMDRFDVPVVQPRKTYALQPGKYFDLDQVDDPVFTWLRDNGKVLGHNNQWVFIECPWREAHTDGAQGRSSTAYSPADYGRAGVGFKCLHGHCAHRNVADFIAWAMENKNA